MDILFLLSFSSACAISDLRTRKIPNSLILCSLVTALTFLTYKVWSEGICVLPDHIAGFCLPLLFCGILAVLKMLGGGDVKMLSVIGLWLGWRGSLCVMWYSLIVGAIWSLAVVLRRKNLTARFHFLYCYLVEVIANGKALPYRRPGDDGSGEFSFAVPVMIAVIWYEIQMLQGWNPFFL